MNEGQAKPAWRDVAILTFAAAVPRAILIYLFFAHLAPTGYDQSEYLVRAQAFHNILASWLHLSGASPNVLQTAYGSGLWPPFYPLVYSVALFLPGDPWRIGNALSIFLSLATVLPIYLIGSRLGGRKAGIWAGSLFGLATTFVDVSPLLWSENLFILLVCWAAYVLLKIAPDSRPLLGKSVILGLLLGAACLTRAEMLLPMIAILAAVFIRSSGKVAWRRAFVVSVVVIAAISPWEIALYGQEGHLVPLSTSGWLNLYLGNKSVEPNGTDIVLLAGNISADTFKPEALRFIQSHPAGYLRLCAERVVTYWRPDSFWEELPPLPGSLVSFLKWSTILENLAILALAVIGLIQLTRSRRALFLWLTLAFMLVPALVLSTTRFGLPNLALFLPIAGAGLAGFSGPRISQCEP